MTEEEYEDQDINEFLLGATKTLNDKTNVHYKAIRDALVNHVNSNFKNEDEMANFFTSLNNVIYPNKDSSDNKKFRKDAFYLYPIIYSANPRLSSKYIDYFLLALQESIYDENRPNFSFLSSIFDNIIDCFFKNNANTKPLPEKKKDSVYQKLLNFCNENIKTNKRTPQSFGCLLLTELIEKCPLVKRDEYLGPLFNRFSNYLEDRWFECKLDLLNCTISLIFTVNTLFKPYANVCLFRVLDYLTDNDWMKRKLAINIVYTLVVYCKNEIMEVKENIIEFLSILKEDPVSEVQEVCLQTLKLIEEADPKAFKKYKINYAPLKKKQKNKLSFQNFIGEISSKDGEDNIFHTEYNENNENNNSNSIRKTNSAFSRKLNRNNLLNTSDNNNDVNYTTYGTRNKSVDKYNKNNKPLYDNTELQEKLNKERQRIKEIERKNNQRRRKIGDVKIDNNYKPTNFKRNNYNNIKKNLSAQHFEEKNNLDEISNNNNINIKTEEPLVENFEIEDYDEANQSLNLVLEQLTKIQNGQNNLMNMINNLKNKVNDNFNTLSDRITKLENDFDDSNIKKVLGNIEDKTKVNDEKKYELIENKWMKGKYNEALTDALEKEKYLYKLLPLVMNENLTRLTPTILEDVITKLNNNLPKLCKGEGESGNISITLSFFSQLIRAKVNLKLMSQMNIKDTLRLLKSEYIVKLSQNDINIIDIILKSLKV